MSVTTREYYTIEGGAHTTRLHTNLDETTAAERATRAAAARNVVSGHAADETGIRATLAKHGVPLNATQDVVDTLPAAVRAAALAAQQRRDEICAILGLPTTPTPAAPKPKLVSPAADLSGKPRVIAVIGNPDDDWRHHAACRNEDPELFFPIGDAGPALLQAEQAKAVCRRCPVTDQCLRWAVDSGQDSGVWGGLDETERRAMRASHHQSAAT